MLELEFIQSSLLLLLFHQTAIAWNLLWFNTASLNIFKLFYNFKYFFFPSSSFQEEDPDCGGVSGLTPSLWLMVVIQVVLLWAVTDSRHYAIPSWPQKNMI